MWKTVLAVVVALLVLAAGGAYVLVRSEWAREQLAERAAAVTHRKVEIGALEVRPGRFTRIHLGRILVDNAEWGSGPHLAEIDAVDVTIDLLQLLRGRVQLPDLKLTRPILLLEMADDGRANWDFAPAKAAAPETRHGVPVIHRLVVENGELTFRDPAKGIDITSQLTTAVGGDPAHRKVMLSGKGRFQKQPFTLDLEGGSLLALREGGEPWPLKLVVAIGPTKGTVEGSMQDPLKLEGVDLRVGLSGPDLAALFPLVGIPTPRTPAYRLEGRLQRQGKVWAMDGFSGKVGSSDLSGSLRIEQGGERPFLKARLASDNLDMRDLAGFLGSRREEAESDRLLPDQPIELARLRSMDMEVQFTARRIAGENMPLKRLDVALGLDGGLLVVDPLAFNLTQGDFSGRVELDGRREVPALRLDLRVAKVDFGQFFAGTRFAGQMSGMLDGRVQIEGRGRSTAEVLAKGDGRVALTMADGTVSALVQELAHVDIATATGLAVTGDQPVPVRCFVADLGIRQGIANADLLVLDTEGTTLTGTGTANLADETMDLRIEGHPKHPSLFSARTPVTLAGRWNQPRIGLEAGGPAARGAAAAVLGALLTPLAAIVPFLGAGTQENPPCAALLQEAR